MTDYYPQEEGAIFDANSYILPCYPEATIIEMSSVTLNASSVAGRIEVAVSATFGDGIGIALKAATSAGVPTRIPVLFYGAAKVTFDCTGTTPTMGKFCFNSITTTFAQGNAVYGSLAVGGGSSYVMGMILQTLASGDDEGLILVGKTS